MLSKAESNSEPKTQKNNVAQVFLKFIKSTRRLKKNSPQTMMKLKKACIKIREKTNFLGFAILLSGRASFAGAYEGAFSKAIVSRCT